MPLTDASAISTPGSPAALVEAPRGSLPRRQQADERIAAALRVVRIGRLLDRRRRRRCAARRGRRRGLAALRLGGRLGRGRQRARECERGNRDTQTEVRHAHSRDALIGEPGGHFFSDGCFGTVPPLPEIAPSCSTNVVATHSATMVRFCSGGVFALIEISLTLMMRGNLLI